MVVGRSYVRCSWFAALAAAAAAASIERCGRCAQLRNFALALTTSCATQNQYFVNYAGPARPDRGRARCRDAGRRRAASATRQQQQLQQLQLLRNQSRR